jgi:DNA-binding NtrC family response regulator
VKGVSDAAESDRGTYTVLVVDDEENVLRSLERLFRREPYRLLTAASAEEALAAVEREPVHLVMADQRMPGMTGIQLIQRIREQHPEVMRVVFTGYIDMNTAIDAINKGQVFRFVTKPWRDDDLKTVVRQALIQYELVAENHKLMDLIERQNLRLRQLNQQLEKQVARRTETIRDFLRAKDKELSDALDAIRTAQAKLLHSERTVVDFLQAFTPQEPPQTSGPAES